MGGKDQPPLVDNLGLNQTTSYPSADGIDWDRFPYEDTQGPLLSSGISQSENCIPNIQDTTSASVCPPTDDLVGDDGFHVYLWAAGIPDTLPSAPCPPPDPIPRLFINACIQVPSTHTGGHIADVPIHV